MRNRQSESKSLTGFTLIEVVVAMTIVGLGVVTLLEIFSLGLRLGARSSERSEALAYGRQAMDEVLIRRKLQESREAGALAQKGRWKLEVQPAPRETSALPFVSAWELKEVSLELEYRDGGRQRQVEFRTLRLVKGKGP